MKYIIHAAVAAILFCGTISAQFPVPGGGASGGGGGGTGDVAGPASATQYTVALFSLTTGKQIGEATGCLWSSTGGGRLTCVGGFASGDGTNPAVVELAELAANGSNSVWLAGAASQSVDTCMVWPSAASTSGQMLADAGTTASVDPDGAGPAVARTCRVMSWVTRTLSGNTTELATVSGAKTASKQLAFDASGNIIASASDIGGGGGGGSDPATGYTFEEDFGFWSTTSGGKGEKVWWYSSGSNANSGFFANDIADHPGVPRLAILDAGNHALFWGGTLNRFNFGATQNWIFLVRADGTTSDYTYKCGISTDPETHPAAEEVVIEKASADTTWFYRTRASGTSSTRVNSTATVNTSWIALKIRKSGSTWYFSTAATLAGLTGATELSIATNIPASGTTFRPFCYTSIGGSVTGWHGLEWDYVRGQVTVSR